MKSSLATSQAEPRLDQPTTPQQDLGTVMTVTLHCWTLGGAHHAAV
jgi:hypothetical protein